MNKIFLIIVLIELTISGKAQIQQAELVATGLTCSMCSNSIYKKLNTLKGIDSIDMDLNKNLFIIYFSKANDIKPNDIKNAVESAGFFVGSLEILLPSINKSESNNSEIVTPYAKYSIVNNISATSQRTIKLKLLDKGFLSHKIYKKIVGKKGYAVSLKDGFEIYHVTVI